MAWRIVGTTPNPSVDLGRYNYGICNGSSEIAKRTRYNLGGSRSIDQNCSLLINTENEYEGCIESIVYQHYREVKVSTTFHSIGSRFEVY